MTTDKTEMVVNAVIAVLLIIMAVGIGYNSGLQSIEATAVKTDCAQYSPSTGKFEWLE